MRYKEHISAIKHKDTSTYAQHILNTGHTYGSMQDVMEVIQRAKKGRYMNRMEKFHIFCTQKENKRMNEILFDPKNPIFETVYNHYTSAKKKKNIRHTLNVEVSTNHP
jgi:hypothetical protein